MDRSVTGSSILDYHLLFYLKETSHQGDSQTLTELKKKTISKEITSIDSEVMKAVKDSVNKRTQDCIQSGGHPLKNIVLEIQ